MRLFALVLGLFVAFLAPAARASALSELQRRGELTWGGDLQGGAPYVFEDPSGNGIRGFEVDIAAALARRLGVRARFVQHDWSNLVPALERGDFDIALNGLEDTPARRALVLSSVPYFVYGETLAVRKGSSARSLADLRGKRVATLNQTVAHDLLKTHPVEIALYEGQQEPYFDLVNERVDAVLLDHVIADLYGCKLKELFCVPGDVARGVYVAAIRKDAPDLKRAIDEALGAMVRDGELESILRAYGLWDARQKELGARAEAPSAAGPRSFDANQVRLFLQGSLVTIAISVAAFAIALPFGLVLAVARAYGGRTLGFLSATYVEIFRGTPVLLQLYVLYFGLAPLVRLGAFEAATLGLGLNYAAYEAEVHRGALASVPRGQTEVARTLGLAPFQVLRYVLFPQAFRNALPALTNDFVALLKDSSLVSVITVVELTKRMTIAAVDLNDWVTPGLACAALYFAMSFPLARLARRLERRLAHDSNPQLA
ncbi:MAG TPA: ABC transporter substrate-binding protein/permease [Polyangiaceae bacterium]|nr:ABC transporter substrate-binding protein/permease [Polyangiaceae bacterium]